MDVEIRWSWGAPAHRDLPVTWHTSSTRGRIYSKQNDSILQMPLIATGPLEAGLRQGDSMQSPQTKARLRAALSGLEDKYLAEQAELGVMKSIEQISSAGDLEQTLRQLLDTDACSSTAARHRYRRAIHSKHVILANSTCSYRINFRLCFHFLMYLKYYSIGQYIWANSIDTNAGWALWLSSDEFKLDFRPAILCILPI